MKKPVLAREREARFNVLNCALHWSKCASIATETNTRQEEVLEQVQHSPTRVPTELQHVSKDQMKQCKLQYYHVNIAIITQVLQYCHENIHISLVKRLQTSPQKTKWNSLDCNILMIILQFSLKYCNILMIICIFRQKKRPGQNDEWKCNILMNKMQ